MAGATALDTTCYSFLTLSSPVVTICTTSLTFSNSTFCPYNVFMCFVWISEQTAIISLYNINWLVFIIETSVFTAWCGVDLSTLSITNLPDRSMWNLWWKVWHWDRFFREYCSFPCQCHSTNAPQPSSSTWCCYQRITGRSLGTFHKSNAVSEIEEHWIGKYFHFFRLQNVNFMPQFRVCARKYAILLIRKLLYLGQHGHKCLRYGVLWRQVTEWQVCLNLRQHRKSVEMSWLCLTVSLMHITTAAVKRWLHQHKLWWRMWKWFLRCQFDSECT